MFWVVLFAVAIGGTGFLLIQTAKPTGDDARRDVGSALLSGAVLSTVFVFAERRIEQAVTERQTREQYQLALSMERDLTKRDFSGLNLKGVVLAGRDLTRANLTLANLSWANLTWANLTEAGLTRADMSGANLRGADLTNVRWDPAKPPAWPDGFVPPENAWTEPD